MAVDTRDGVATTADRDHGGLGRPLILLHGGGGNLETMDSYAARLGEGRRVVALDLRGCGQSGAASRYRWPDLVLDVEAVVREIGGGEVDVLGHSLGGMVAGFYGTTHPQSRVVNIDGFPGGTLTTADPEAQKRWIAWGDRVASHALAMHDGQQVGDADWRDVEVAQLVHRLGSSGYSAPNVGAVARRQFVRTDDGLFRRRPLRELTEVIVADRPHDVLRAYRDARARTLIVRCLEFAPAELDPDLDELVAARHGQVEVVRLPIGHMAPAWDAVDQVAALARAFLDAPLRS